MTAIIVIMSVFALVLLILMTVVKVRVSSDGELRLRVGVGPFMLGLIPAKKKKARYRSLSQKKYLKLMREAEKSKKSKNDTKPEEGAKKKEKGSFSETKDFILEVLSRIGKYTHRLHARIDCLKVNVGGEDSASAAITYGIVSQGVSYLVEILDCNTKLKIPHPERVSVVCDFTAEKMTFVADVTFGVRVIDALRCAFEVLMIKVKRDGAAQINTNKIPSKTGKDEHNNGRK